MKSKLQMIINILLIILMPFMTYLNISEAKVNVAMSDMALLLVGVLFLINIKDFFLNRHWIYLLYFACLVISITLSQFVSQFNNAFLHVKNIVMLIEIMKTLVVAMYFFTAFMFIKNKYDYKLSLITISLGSIPVIIIGGASYIFTLLGKDFIIHAFKIESLRFKGTFEDPNLCALYFIVIFFVSLLNFKVIKNIFFRYFMLGISVLSVFIILLTMSRGGCIAFVGAILISILLNIRNFKKESLLVVITGVIIILMSINLDFDFQKGKITNAMINRVQDSLNKNADDINRVKLMKSAYEMGNDNFFFGVGKGSFPLNSYKYLSKNSDEYKRQLIPHNTILGFYSQQGIVGVVIFILLPVGILFKIIKSGKKQSSYLVAIFIGIFIHSITINIENIRFVWYILGLMSAGEMMNIDLDFVPATKINKRTCNVAITILLLLVLFSYMDISRKLSSNIYTYNGSVYDKKISVEKPGDYQLSFDVFTDNSLHSIEIYNGHELVKKMELKSAYGFVLVPVHIDDECRVVFRSNQKGWMKVRNAFFIQGNKKFPLYNYILLPTSVENWFNEQGFLVYSEQASFKNQIVVEYNKLDAFDMLRGKVIRYSNLSHLYQFDIKSQRKVDVNYQLNLLLDYQSISSLLPEEYQRNHRTHGITLNNTGWREGHEYTVKNAELFTSDNFDLYGRYYDRTNNIFIQNSYFPIHYDLAKENQEIIGLGESKWINICYGKDKNDNINMTNNGWVESGRMNLQPGDYNITFKAQGSFLGEYSKVRVRDSELNDVAEISLDGNMKEYTVQYHVDVYKSGQSFILELINYEADKNGGNRQVLLKDWLKVDRKLG